jgi:hypothetical protein
MVAVLVVFDVGLAEVVVLFQERRQVLKGTVP